MKQNNIGRAIRTSHYQNQDALYDRCDEYGLPIAENNLESRGTWDTHQAGIRAKGLGLTISRSGRLSCLISVRI